MQFLNLNVFVQEAGGSTLRVIIFGRVDGSLCEMFVYFVEARLAISPGFRLWATAGSRRKFSPLRSVDGDGSIRVSGSEGVDFLNVAGIV